MGIGKNKPCLDETHFKRIMNCKQCQSQRILCQECNKLQKCCQTIFRLDLSTKCHCPNIFEIDCIICRSHIIYCFDCNSPPIMKCCQTALDIDLYSQMEKFIYKKNIYCKLCNCLHNEKMNHITYLNIN